MLTFFLHAGGGIVFDSDPYEEYQETMNKLMSNSETIISAEKKYTSLQSRDAPNGQTRAIEREALGSNSKEKKTHVDLAAG
jgi:anthranilate synthase component 1